MTEYSPGTGDPIKGPPKPWRGLTGAILKYVEARGLLAQIEAQDAMVQVAMAIGFGILAAILALGAWILVVPALVWIVCDHMGWRKDIGLLVTGGIHAMAAVILVKAMVNRLRGGRWFAETLDQFKKDRAWIAQHTEKP